MQSGETRSTRDGEIGSATGRREDAALLRGDGVYTDDIYPEDALYMAICRSSMAHARIETIDTAHAEAMDRVEHVFRADDIRSSDAPGVIPSDSTLTLFGADDSTAPVTIRRPLIVPDRPLLADDVVRYLGEPIAVVVATDRYAAHDAANRITVSYERLDAVSHPAAATADDAPVIHDSAPDNVAFDWEGGRPDETRGAFGRSENTVSVDIGHQRLAPTSIEPRAAVAQYSPADGLFLRLGTQVPYPVRDVISNVLGVPADEIHVRVPDVGGGFGGKSKYYPGEFLAAWCAYQLERPVKWTARRVEAFQSDIHGRARTIHGELAFDDDGVVSGLRVESRADMGAYVSRAAPGTRTGSFIDVLSGQYEIPAIHCRITGVFTTTAPVDSYRGSSRPQSLLIVERLMERAARSLDMDPVEFRRLNQIDPDSFPYETPLGTVYDSGRYGTALDRALELVGYENLRERQRRLREEGRYLGVGLCGVIDNAGSSQPESALVRVSPSGSVVAHCGTSDQGQGHRTTYAQIVADELGVPYADVTVEEGDTSQLPSGGGTYGSRSIVVGGEALRAAAEEVRDRAQETAADRLEASPHDIEFADGAYFVSGAPERSISLTDVAREYSEASDTDGALEAVRTETTPSTYPFGTHIAVVEVDPTTGDVKIEDYVAVDDCGVQVNPRLVRGQLIGGIIQGISQALFEDAVYDENGTLQNGSLQDYIVPTAEQVPAVTLDHTTTPSPTNRLGVKGVGESGSTGAPAAVANAIVDALAPFGVDHLDLPITPERVWQAVRHS